MISPTTGSFDNADYLISIQRYCADDAKIAMKMMKNRAYGSVAPVGHILHISEPYLVDGDPWYQIDLDKEAAQWLRELCDSRVVELKDIGRCFNVPEDIYILTKLKWT
jgi:hypothetical protein